jgi:hypothetical protein
VKQQQRLWKQGKEEARKLQATGPPLVIANVNHLSLADDPLTVAVEDALQPLNRFFNMKIYENTVSVCI